MLRHTEVSMVLILIMRLAGVDGPCRLGQKLGIVVNLIKTGPVAVFMATAQQVSFCFFCDKHSWCQV